MTVHHSTHLPLASWGEVRYKSFRKRHNAVLRLGEEVGKMLKLPLGIQSGLEMPRCAPGKSLELGSHSWRGIS